MTPLEESWPQEPICLSCWANFMEPYLTRPYKNPENQLFEVSPIKHGHATVLGGKSSRYFCASLKTANATC